MNQQDVNFTYESELPLIEIFNFPCHPHVWFFNLQRKWRANCKCSKTTKEPGKFLNLYAAIFLYFKLFTVIIIM